MTRLLYRGLVRLHPRAFRERFGDEMLSVFDEAASTGSAAFFADGLESLLRQWLFRSELWKMAVGAVLSGVFLIGWAYSESRWPFVVVVTPMSAKPISPLNKAEFNSETAQAVAMLARFRKADKRKSRRHNASESEIAAPLNDSSQD